MLKKLLICALLATVPFESFAKPKQKPEEPVVHLTDEEIYTELQKLALVFETARDSFVDEADEKKMLEAAMNGM
ncbi:MAG: hypothetical protein IKM94_03560, partial [Alphaproteobacteria bacterium]|nr:hypothetical protein [Alphaproteobacteria bacterium]